MSTNASTQNHYSRFDIQRSKSALVDCFDLAQGNLKKISFEQVLTATSRKNGHDSAMAPRDHGVDAAPRDHDSDEAPRDHGVDAALRHHGVDAVPRHHGVDAAPRHHGIDAAPRH
ncbi:hypothetical protein EDB85DRAFT_2161947 [Lactarius pseudohatsudake]|nr:hypothetical protein EDB85DRAFT_2161947 [Lactarius pseudohatsudake]